MRIHHGYIGAFLVVWSIFATVFKSFIIGEFNPWLVWSGLGVGTVLVLHDFLYHFRTLRSFLLSYYDFRLPWNRIEDKQADDLLKKWSEELKRG